MSSTPLLQKGMTISVQAYKENQERIQKENQA
jgi:hypothetical protein